MVFMGQAERYSILLCEQRDIAQYSLVIRQKAIRLPI